jgi:hypothetical protein
VLHVAPLSARLATQARDRNNGNLNDGMDHQPSIIAKRSSKFKLMMSPIIGDLDLNLALHLLSDDHKS